MMRSEKRDRTTQPAHNDSHSRPRRRRRKGAGFVYKFLMMLLLLLLWPFGLLMLWRRKVRWSGAMKLLVSLVTLAACILIYGFALTIPVNNPQYNAIQDKANDYLDVSADWLVNAGHVVADKSVEVWDGVTNLSDAAARRGMEVLPDALEKGVDLAGQAKVKFVELANKVGWKLELPAPEPTAAPEPAPTQAPDSTGRLGALEKAEKVEANVADSKLPIYVPASAPDAAKGRKLTSGMLERGIPTPTPKPTAVPTPAPTEVPEESAEPEAEPETDNVG